MRSFIIFCIIFFFGKCQSPKTFSKYYANITHITSYNDITKVRELFFINVNEELGVCKEWDNPYELFVYHIDKDTPGFSFMLVSAKGEPQDCFIRDINFNEIDVIGFIISRVKDYIGEVQCNSNIKMNVEEDMCDAWELEGGRKYFAYKNGIPCKVFNEEGKPYLLFDDFKYGDDSFDESTEFKLPVDPKTCRK